MQRQAAGYIRAAGRPLLDATTPRDSLSMASSGPGFVNLVRRPFSQTGHITPQGSSSRSTMLSPCVLRVSAPNRSLRRQADRQTAAVLRGVQLSIARCNDCDEKNTYYILILEAMAAHNLSW